MKSPPIAIFVIIKRRRAMQSRFAVVRGTEDSVRRDVEQLNQGCKLFDADHSYIYDYLAPYASPSVIDWNNVEDEQ